MCAVSASATIIPLAAENEILLAPETRGCMINLVGAMSPAWVRLEMRRIAQAGFNLALFPFFNNGWTLFPCAAAREAGMARINPSYRKWDPLALATHAAREAGLAVWGYARPFEFNPRYSVIEHKLLRKFPQWSLQAHPSHETLRTRRFEQWHACPINLEYRRYVADVITEMAAAYPIEGALLDYTGFGLRGGTLEESPYCFCESCRGRYREATRRDLAADAEAGRMGEIRAWQMEQVHDNLLYLRHRYIRTRRTLPLVCRAAPHWRYDPESAGPPGGAVTLADWPALLREGAIEELAIDHDFEDDAAVFPARLAADFACLGDQALVLPMLYVNDVRGMGGAVAALRRYPVSGFIAELHRPMTAEDAAWLAENLFSEAAMLPESNPVRSAFYWLDRIRLAHEDQPMLHDLMTDLLRLLSRQLPMPTDFLMLQMIETNIHGVEQRIRRGQLETIRIPESTMRSLGLARRYVRMACLDVRS